MVTEKTKRIASALTRLSLTCGEALFLAALFRPVCMENGVCNLFLLAVLVGIPFGIGRMIVVLPPASYGISGMVGVLALDFIIGGLIGFVCLAFRFLENLMHLIIAVIS